MLCPNGPYFLDSVIRMPNYKKEQVDIDLFIRGGRYVGPTAQSRESFAENMQCAGVRYPNCSLLVSVNSTVIFVSSFLCAGQLCWASFWLETLRL